jgi:hypothetical protein
VPRKLKTSARIVLLAALLPAALTALAQNSYTQYLPVVQGGRATAQPTPNGTITATSTPRFTPTQTPVPTTTPGPGAACGGALNATAYAGSFAFAFSDTSGAVKVDRATNGTLRFQNPVTSTGSTSWDIDFSGLESTVADTDAGARSYSGGPHTARSTGYLTIYADTCTASLVVRPKITQTMSSLGGSGVGPDQVFNLFVANFPLGAGNAISSSAPIDVTCRDQIASDPPGAPIAYADLATNVADGPISNDSACDLYTAQGGTGLRGKLGKKASLSINLAPSP